MRLEITGKIEFLGDTTPVAFKNGSTFSKRELILDCSTYDRFTGKKDKTNYVQMEFSGEKGCARLDPFKVGDLVTVAFVLQGFCYDDKNTGEKRYFTKIVGYDCAEYGHDSQTDGQAAVQAIQEPVQSPNGSPAPFPPPVNAQGVPQPQKGSKDDLPF